MNRAECVLAFQTKENCQTMESLLNGTIELELMGIFIESLFMEKKRVIKYDKKLGWKNKESF